MTSQKVIPMHDRQEILGVPVSLLDMQATLAHIDLLIQSNDPHLVATADSSGIVIAQTDTELLSLYQSASLVTPDSYGVVWALKKKGKKCERVSGVDIADQLCALSAQKGYSIYLLGSEPGIAEAAAERLRLKHPGCRIIGTHHGYFPPSENQFVAEQIAPLKPDILLVAMGIPRQEKFIAETMGIIRAKVAIGVGGSLDVFSGRAKRAPKVIQKLKLEWLWRTLLNPKKMAKAKLLPRFAWLVLRSKG
ncbi:WecB/TagA/CpsF family glycosyltransferase [Kamptonema cortianum]|nr:WecB/TagA/CpsF family glycosyltransferase [Geitlerinema splendidum]MDK3158530.1 WecB/TagA/CpsF family glycosyltransferase [Kamptonema cortianum]